MPAFTYRVQSVESGHLAHCCEMDVAAVLVALLALPAATGGAHSKSWLGAATSGNGGGSPSATPVLNVGSTAGVNMGEGGCAGG